MSIRITKIAHTAITIIEEITCTITFDVFVEQTQLTTRMANNAPLNIISEFKGCSRNGFEVRNMIRKK